MGNTVAKITSKIVEVTGNDATKAFIGKIVTRKSTEKGIVYAIGSTGYVLSTAEYKKFAEAGAIAQASILPKKKSQASTVVKPQRKDLSSTTPLASAAKAKTSEAVPAKGKETIEPRKVEQYDLGSEEHQALLETSDFLMNYPKPSFELDTPKHLSFFDKKDDFKERATGFFDRIGKKGRDKLVDAMSN